MFGTNKPNTNLLKEMGWTEKSIRNKHASMSITIDPPSPGRRPGPGEHLGADKSGRIIVGSKRNFKRMIAGVSNLPRRGVSELRTTGNSI